MPSNAISIEGVTHRFGEMTAVDDLSLQVPTGSVFGFLGPNGAGKTTTINLLLGLLEPQTGRIEVLGSDVSANPDQARSNMGALLESDGLYEQMTAEDNLDFYGRVWRMPAADRKDRIRELLTHMKLWDRRGDKVARWSRGMRRRLALARTLLHRPPVIILDEPTAGLDVVHTASVHDDLESLSQRENVTVFITTHNMPEAERLCETIAVISSGRLVGLGGPADLRMRARTPVLEITGHDFPADTEAILMQLPAVQSVEIAQNTVRVSISEGADSSSIISALVEAGAKIEEARRSTASLEEAFLSLVSETETAGEQP